MSHQESPHSGQASPAVRALRDHIASLYAERDALTEKIQNAERALSQLLAQSGESFAQLIDMAKVRMLRAGEQSYDEIRDHIRKKGGVVIKGDLDHRLRQSLSRAVTAGTVVVRNLRSRGDDLIYDLGKKERDRYWGSCTWRS
jgi:hypothetical protein